MCCLLSLCLCSIWLRIYVSKEEECWVGKISSCQGNPMVGSQKNTTQISEKIAATYVTECYQFNLFFKCIDQWHFSDYCFCG